MRERVRRTAAVTLSVLFIVGAVAGPILTTGPVSGATTDAPAPAAGTHSASMTNGSSASMTNGSSAPMVNGSSASMAASAPNSTAATAATIDVQNSLRQVDRVGEYGVRTRVVVPDRVVSLEIRIPDRASDVSANGFSRESGTTWVWDEQTDRPSVSYRMPANRTIEDGGPLEGDGRYLFVDTGEWAIVNPPQIGGSWRSTGEARFVRENVVAGEGVASDSMAYLGPFESHTRSAHGQRFTLIVPESAALASDPQDVLGTLEHASGALRIGDRDSDVFVIAAPTREVGWGVRGLQSGPADMWVRDTESVDIATDVWTHEYVHTRQGYRTAESGRWTIEAAATYYAALLALDRGDIDVTTFQRALRRGEQDPQATAVLSQPSTWRNDANYWKGALVLGELDRRIRLATDGERTAAHVLRDLNAATDPTTNEDVLAAAEAAGGRDLRTSAQSFTTTERTPTMWNRSAHDDAFGTLPARIDYSIADPNAVRATGEYRDRAVDRDPVQLVVGETLQLRVSVMNDGGAAGSYDLTARLDGDRITRRTGRLAANESTVERIDHRFTAPGTHELTIGGQHLSVEVTEPASVTVRELAVDTETVARGEPVTVTADVTNSAPIPGYSSVTLRVNDRAVETREVRLDSGERTTLQFEVVPTNGGETTIELGEQRVTLTVTTFATDTHSGDPASDATEEDSDPIPSTEESIPGFGSVAAVIALLVATLVTAVRATRRET